MVLVTLYARVKCEAAAESCDRVERVVMMAESRKLCGELKGGSWKLRLEGSKSEARAARLRFRTYFFDTIGHTHCNCPFVIQISALQMG